MTTSSQDGINTQVDVPYSASPSGEAVARNERLMRGKTADNESRGNTSSTAEAVPLIPKGEGINTKGLVDVPYKFTNSILF